MKWPQGDRGLCHLAGEGYVVCLGSANRTPPTPQPSSVHGTWSSGANAEFPADTCPWRPHDTLAGISEFHCRSCSFVRAAAFLSALFLSIARVRIGRECRCSGVGCISFPSALGLAFILHLWCSVSLFFQLHSVNQNLRTQRLVDWFVRYCFKQA